MHTIKRVFIGLEMILFVLIIFNIPSSYGIKFRYLSILFCFGYVFVQKKSSDERLMLTALILTLIADLFLLVIGDFFVVGVMVFCVVQSIYSYRLNGKKNLYIYFKIALFIVMLVMIVWGLFFEEFDFLLLGTVIYISLLMSNVFFAFRKRSYLFAVGLLLFLFCDIFVGLSNIRTYGVSNTIIEDINQHFIDFQWFFYIPSQVLIALSCNELNRSRRIKGLCIQKKE